MSPDLPLNSDSSRSPDSSPSPDSSSSPGSLPSPDSASPQRDRSRSAELDTPELELGWRERDVEQGSLPEPVSVEIYDQVYNLRGSDAAYILKLAEYVDSKMRAVSQQTATVDSVRLAVLAALNLADELSQARKSGADARLTHTRAASLRGLLDEVLEDERKTGS